MLDVANQFGDGGLRRIHALVRRQGMSEMDLLEAIADQTVEEMPDKFKQGVRARRDSFLNTPLLSDALSWRAPRAGDRSAGHNEYEFSQRGA
jgi:hypothetical protein